jgi:hypothetical protein
MESLAMGRNAIGIEKYPEYFGIASRRIQDHINGVVPKPVRRPKTGTMVPLLKGFE